MNNWFLNMMPDPCHPDLGDIVSIHHQENPDPLPYVDSELKGDLSLRKKTDMRMKEHP